ncbi:putative leucine-rich repeat receptor-like protein kinase At1g68400 [Tasmannia lanceolata]|uniref:putative leucine-rich repeat receptor-like protein kinase At1g68400 n=1 Tax=Tasmannia lanceolata TaxID=3420 RepID=UPI004062BD3D
MELPFTSLVFFLLFTLSTLSLSHSSDSDTLLQFKSLSDSSNSLSSWNDSSTLCSGSWLGITCQNGRVTHLILQNLNLNGPIETLTRLDQLRVLSLNSNKLTSSFSLDFSPWKNMKRLYLSQNSLAGNFPAGISHLHRLRRLDLSHNQFSGQIPYLSQLTHLLTLRLELNSFTGTLPYLPPTITDFNVSGNNLAGKIPNALSLFLPSSFAGNKNLCGKPIPGNCSTKTVNGDPLPIQISRRGRKLSRRAVMVIIFADMAILSVIIGIFLFCFCGKRKERIQRGAKKEEGVGVNKIREREKGEEMVFFEGCEGFRKVEDLLKASAEMLGKGIVGTTYKAVMEGGGKVVVVKRVRDKRKKEIECLMREIGGFRHENVVSLRAYYSSRDEMLLVYDFLSNGSLHLLLHGNRGPGRTPIDWTTRLKFASGAAKGLTFLHESCKSKLSHGHLSSSNVLIDQNGNARISDFALHHLLPLSLPLPNTQKLSQKNDVYSFGIILLEILTGKMSGEDGTNLAEWVRRAVRDESMVEVFDLELLRFKEMEEEMIGLLQVALLCLNPTARERPKMRVVHRMIDDIRARRGGGGGRRGDDGAHSSLVNDLSSDSSPALSVDTPTFTSS